MAVGIDDAFLMIQSWQRIALRNRLNKHNQSIPGIVHSEIVEIVENVG